MIGPEKNTPEQNRTKKTTVQIDYNFSNSLPRLLSDARISLAISTYQAGKVVLVGVERGNISVSLHQFERAMGIASQPDGDSLAVTTVNSVWLLKNARQIAAQVDPGHEYDACFLTRMGHVTGEIQAHELQWVGTICGL